MNLTITTTGNTLFKGECKLVQMPGTDGLFEIMDRHAPLIAMLGKGKIKVQQPDGNDLFFDIESGAVKMRNNQIVILVEG
jgi:F-type H+-transporting ATPase subunit epsilon